MSVFLLTIDQHTEISVIFCYYIKMKICGKWDNRIFPLNLKNSDSDPEDNTNQYPVINLQGFRKKLTLYNKMRIQI
jgi:hypothetical protein